MAVLVVMAASSWVIGQRERPEGDRPSWRASAPLGVHTEIELERAAKDVVGFLRGRVPYSRIHLAPTVALHLGSDGGPSERRVAREMLRSPSNWKVRSDVIGWVYDFEATGGPCPSPSCFDEAKLKARVGSYFQCLEYDLPDAFRQYSRLPHVGTLLIPTAPDTSCLSSYNLTVVFDPTLKPPTVVAAILDHWEW